jgi:hypothetical protein
MNWKLALSALLVSAIVAIGCSGGSEKPQSIASPQRVTQIVEMRKLYDANKGNWDSMSAADKEQFTKLAGDEKAAKTMWEAMGKGNGAQAGPR